MDASAAPAGFESVPYLAAQTFDLAMVRTALLVLAVAGICACGDVTVVTSDASPSSPSPTDSPIPRVCVNSGAATADWPAPDSSPQLPEILSASIIDGGLFVNFRRGIPAFDVTTQPNTHFTKDPSGQTIDLAGNAGVLIHLRGFVGDPANFSGIISTTSLGPLVKAVRVIGNFEGVITIAVGLDSAGCANVFSTPVTLSFFFVKPAA